MKSESGLWRKVLFAIRRVVARKEAVTSTSLADEFGIPVKNASSWLNILGKYGYVARTGKAAAGGRWAYTWELTQFGHDYQRREKRTRPALRIASNPPPGEG